ncbi:MAG: prepilin peptidase [Vicinamibacterales bacterium]|nr:prepilin peptidase [Vicinamibacterales bacterium]
MPPPIIALAFLFGLIVGSFLNVCIHRLPRGQSLVHPPSTCPSCQRRLRWRDNVPVISWVLLRARCGQCGEPISARYPIVELTTGVLFALVAAITPDPVLAASHLIFTAALIVLFAIDLEHQILPNVITLPGIVAGFLFALVTPVGWLDSLLGILLGGGILYAIAAGYYAVRKEEGLGMGDVKMLAMIGAFLGWQAVLITLVLASVSGSIIGVGMIAASRGSMKYALPFGTFLAMGAFAAMTIGQPLLEWYMSFY